MGAAESAIEAAHNLLQQTPSLSKKINYDAINSLVEWIDLV